MSPEIKTEVPAEIVGEAEAKHDRASRLIAVAAVVTTLLAATTGFFQASALRTHDEADAHAERLGALSAYAASGNGEQAQVQIERFQLLQQEQGQQANAAAFQDYAGQSSAGLEATRWGAVVRSTEEDTAAIARGQHLIATCPAPSSDSACFGPDPLIAICSPAAEPRTCGTAPGQGGWYSPEEDPAFPTRYQQTARREAYFLLARRDAANELADAAENQFVHFALALTTFAIAVFLFGYSLTPQGRKRRRLFTRVATAFAAFGGIWAGIHAATGMPSQPLAAASAFADGEVALNDGDFKAADAALTRATRLRPKFVDAWADLALAKFGEGTPTPYVDNEQTQIASVPAMKAADQADRQAIANGSESPIVRFDLGGNLLYLGLLTHNDAEVRQSRSLDAGADLQFREQLNEGRHPGDYLLSADFNVAEADLVDGSPSAQEEYRAAEQRMLRLQNEIDMEPVVAGALTDLSLIALTRPTLTAQTKALADQVVAAASRGDWNDTPDGYARSGRDHPSFAQIQMQPDPGHLQFTLSGATHFDTQRDLLSVQWEYRDPVNGNWEVLPDISGPVAPSSLVTLTPLGQGMYVSSNPSFLAQSFPHTCLPPGQYRADLWVNGSFAGESRPTSTPWSGLASSRLGAVDAVFCGRTNWRGHPLGSGAAIFVAPHASSGAAILVVPASAISGAATVADVMRKVVRDVNAGAGGLFANLGTVSSDEKSYFMNFPDARQQLWGYTPGGSQVGALASAAGVSSDHELYVALVFSTAARASLSSMLTSLQDIVLSFSQL